MGCCDDDDDYGCKVVFLTSEFSGRLGTGFLLWGQERGRSCMWKTLRWRVGIMKGNAEGCSICSNAAMLRTMLCGFVCNRVLHLVPPWPCRSLLCSCWVRLAIAKSYCPSFSFLFFVFLGFMIACFGCFLEWILCKCFTVSSIGYIRVFQVITLPSTTKVQFRLASSLWELLS